MYCLKCVKGSRFKWMDSKKTNKWVDFVSRPLRVSRFKWIDTVERIALPTTTDQKPHEMGTPQIGKRLQSIMYLRTVAGSVSTVEWVSGHYAPLPTERDATNAVALIGRGTTNSDRYDNWRRRPQRGRNVRGHATHANSTHKPLPSCHKTNLLSLLLTCLRSFFTRLQKRLLPPSPFTYTLPRGVEMYFTALAKLTYFRNT